MELTELSRTLERENAELREALEHYIANNPPRDKEGDDSWFKARAALAKARAALAKGGGGGHCCP